MYQLSNPKLELLRSKKDSSLSAEQALSNAFEIIESIEEGIPPTQRHKLMAEVYRVASKKTRKEERYHVYLPSSFLSMVEIQDSPNTEFKSIWRQRLSSKVPENVVVEGLLKMIKSAKSDIIITCGESGLLERNPELQDSLITQLEKGINVSLYYLDIQNKEIITRLADKGCNVIKGSEYSKSHYWIIDESAYLHFHPRCNDMFIYNDIRRLEDLKQDFEKLKEGSIGPIQQYAKSSMSCNIKYDDEDVIDVLLSHIRGASIEIIIVCGLGLFLQKSSNLVDAIASACQRGVKTSIYVTYMPDEKILEELKKCDCKIVRRSVYPRLHYWIVDNFIYESSHPRQGDQFIYNSSGKSSELRTEFKRLAKA
jgi:phosphatidylserine/phosphatidylglycerophosphate/cardiolipin synthase-like enzyme